MITYFSLKLLSYMYICGKSGENDFMKRNLISSYENKFLNSGNYFYLDFISHYKSDSNHNHLVDDSVAFTAVISDSLKEIMILCFPFMFLWYFPIRRQDFYFITELLGRIFFWTFTNDRHFIEFIKNVTPVQTFRLHYFKTCIYFFKI